MKTSRNLGILTILVLLGGGCSATRSASSPANDTTRSASSPTSDTIPSTSDVGSEPTSGETRAAGGAGRSVVPYTTFDDCDDFLGWTKAQLLERVTPYGIDPYGWDPTMRDRGAPTLGAPDETAAPAASESPSAPQPAADMSPAPDSARVGGTSTTNTQELGVDESDMTETDGRYVYSILDNVLRSVDLETSTLLAELPLSTNNSPNQPEMILFRSTLLVSWQDWSTPSGETVIRRYSITDGVPSFQESTQLEGTLLSVRSVNGIARVTMTAGLLPRISFVTPRYNGGSQSSIDEAEDVAFERNRAIIDELTVDDLLPRRYTRAEDGTRGNVETALPCELVGHPGEFNGFGLTWVASLDLADPFAEITGSGGIVADGQTVYVSTDHLFVAAQRSIWPEAIDGVSLQESVDPTTALHSFSLTDPTRIKYVASGEVPGLLLNSYSMSEFDGHLRVATTEWTSDFGGGQDSGVHIFEQQQDKLVEVGAVRGLGEGEQIQAVRFHGALGYVVTFRRTDPLFVLDLSDPAAPSLSGKLEIPGYSSYLHPIGDGLLLGVGFTGDENGLTGGTQLSLFDVNDPKNPMLLTATPLGEVSEATFDPHAFLWWPETGDVIVPKDMRCQFSQTTECSTAVVIHIDLAARTMSETTRLVQRFHIRRALVANGDLITLSPGELARWRFGDFVQLADVRFDIPGTTADNEMP